MKYTRYSWSDVNRWGRIWRWFCNTGTVVLDWGGVDLSSWLLFSCGLMEAVGRTVIVSSLFSWMFPAVAVC